MDSKKHMTFAVLAFLVLACLVASQILVSSLADNYEHDHRIRSLLRLSALVRGYNVRDRNGLVFGIAYRPHHSWPHQAAVLLSGKWMNDFPVDAYDLQILFPTCANADPGFPAMINDLLHPAEFMRELGPDYVPPQEYRQNFKADREYFRGDPLRMRAVEVFFLKDCEDLFAPGQAVQQRLTVTVPQYEARTP